VIALQAGVIKKFLQGFMAPKQKRRKHQGEDYITKAEEVDEEKKMAEEAKVLFTPGFFFSLVLSLSNKSHYISSGSKSCAVSPYCKFRVHWVCCLWVHMFPGYSYKCLAE